MAYMLDKSDLNVEIQVVKRVTRKNKSLRRHRRYMVIFRHLQCHLNNQIAEMELLCANTVGTYINNYNKFNY